MPSTARLSVRAMMTKSGSSRASHAARILPTISSSGTRALFSMCPHFLGKIWSSRWMPATPAASYSRTVRMTLTALP
jgi:hypothetical protein